MRLYPIVAAVLVSLSAAAAQAAGPYPYPTRYQVYPVIHVTAQPLLSHGVPVTLATSTYFDSGRSEPRSGSEDTLIGLVARVNRLEPHYGMGRDGYVTDGRIVGHTDSVGGSSYNERLSQRRAESVRQYLAAHGVDTGALEVTGMGEAEPIASNRTRDGRARNRRTEIQLELVTRPGY